MRPRITPRACMEWALEAMASVASHIVAMNRRVDLWVTYPRGRGDGCPLCGGTMVLETRDRRIEWRICSECGRHRAGVMVREVTP